MGKKRRRIEKEGELANFPEEQTPILLSPRYLAIAASLILVSSAFASLILKSDVTGFAASATMQRWRDQGIVDDWESGGLSSRTFTNERDDQGNRVVPAHYRCPGQVVDIPDIYASTSNQYGCFNTQDKNGLLAMCAIADDKERTTWIKCVSS